MADNRMYLVCAECGGRIYLGKSHYGGLYYANYSDDGKTLDDKMNAFYDAHENCGGTAGLLGTNFFIAHEYFSDERLDKIRDMYKEALDD